MKQSEIYEQVTQQIIEQLESGVAPWRRPWAMVGGGMPMNIQSRPYQGVNILLLWAKSQAKGYASNRWLTFNQAKTLGGHVNRGEKGTKIVFWQVKTDIKADKRTGEETEDRRFFCRQFTIFNVDQCSGLERFTMFRPVCDFTDFAPAEDAIAATDADIRHGGNSAYFDRSADYIQLPSKSAFESESAYYSTALHEVTHWSGHESRLNRIDKLSRFGNEAYAAEELVAELGASFLAATLGIPNAPVQDNAAYLKSWLNVLRADSKAIFTASTAASAAADYVLSFSRAVESEETEEELVAA